MLKRNSTERKLHLFVPEQRESFPEGKNSTIEGFKVQNANQLKDFHLKRDRMNREREFLECLNRESSQGAQLEKVQVRQFFQVQPPKHSELPELW